MKKIVKGEDVKDIIPGKKSNIPIPQGKVTPTKVKLKDYKKEREEKTSAKKEIEPEIKKGPKASDKASLDKLKDAVDQLKEKVISEDNKKEKTLKSKIDDAKPKIEKLKDMINKKKETID